LIESAHLRHFSQDGAYLARLLLNKGYEVFGTSRDAQIGGFANLVRLGVRDRVRLESMAANDFRMRDVVKAMVEAEWDRAERL
jgi:GDP-D-mannose dehydratase